MQWNFERFADLLKMDPVLAWEYRFESLGEPIPEEYGRNKEVVEDKVDKKDVMKLLRDKGISFSNAAPFEKLVELAKANNLF